ALLTPDVRRHEVHDTLAPGLTLRITPNGRKTWTILYRHCGRLRRLTLGLYPALDLGPARTEARRQYGRILEGADPAGEKRTTRQARAHTVASLYYEFRRYAEHLRSWSEYRRVYEHEVLPRWHNRSVSEITRQAIR